MRILILLSLLSSSALAVDTRVVSCTKAKLGVTIWDYEYDGVRATVFAGRPRSHILMNSKPIKTSQQGSVMVYMGPNFTLEVMRDKDKARKKGRGVLEYNRGQGFVKITGMRCSF